MFRRLVTPLALILALTIAVKAQQRGDETPGWMAWLYENGSGNVTAVDSDGEARQITLPLAPGLQYIDREVAVSPSGGHIAYLAFDSMSNRHLFVYDVALDSVVTSYPIPPEWSYTRLDWFRSHRSSAVAFNEAASRLAIPLVQEPDFRNYEAGWTWEIAVIDYSVGEVVATLSSEDEAVAQLDPYLIPVIYDYTGDDVTFLEAYWATHGFGGLTNFRGYMWNTETGDLTRGEVVYLTGDRLAATGETVVPARDERLCTLPAGEGPILLYPDNVLQAYDPAAAATRVFYHNSHLDIRGGTFIQNGERILASTRDNFEFTNGWAVIDRDGTVMTTRYFSDERPVYGTPDGFVYLEASGTPALVHVDTRSGALMPDIVWEAAETGPLSVVHVDQRGAPPESYTPWADVLEPMEQADDAPGWTAWLYESGTGCVTLVESSGSSRQFTLGQPGLSLNVRAPSIAVSPSGSHIAYVEWNNLYVYDIALDRYARFNVLSPGAQATSLDSFGEIGAGSLTASFNEAASRLAVGSVMRASSPDAKPEPGWDLVTVDYSTGEVVAALSNEDEAAAQVSSFGVLPVILHYAGDEVTFAALENYDTLTFPSGLHPVFTWNTETGEVTPNESLDSGFADILAATGEVIGPQYDERLPAAPTAADFPCSYPNVLRAYDPAGTAHIVYNNAEIERGYFVQNGERILVRTRVFDMPNHWIIIERDGTEIAETPPRAWPHVFGTPDGFVYLEESETPALVHVNTRSGDFESEIVWQAQTPVKLVFVQSDASPPESYTPWADLIEPELQARSCTATLGP